MTIEQKATKILTDLRSEGFDAAQIADYLCDGAALEADGYTDDDQDVIETAYYITKSA